MFFFLAFISYLFCQFFIINCNIVIPCFRHFIQTQNFYRCRWTCHFHCLTFIVEHCTNSTLGSTNNQEIPYMQSPCLYQQCCYCTAAFIQFGFDNFPFCITVWICFQFRYFSYQQNHFQQFFNPHTFFRGYRHHNGVAAPFFRNQTIIGQFLFDTVRVCFRFVNFVNCYDNWHTCCFCMVNCFDGLRHYTVVGSNYQNRNICYLCTTGTHRCKRFVTWSIQEGNFLSADFYLISTDMLCDTAGFGRGNMGRTNFVQQGCFTMVNMTHNGNNRRTMLQIFRFVFDIGK